MFDYLFCFCCSFYFVFVFIFCFVLPESFALILEMQFSWVHNYGLFGFFPQLFEDNILLNIGFHCCFEKYAVNLITVGLLVGFVGDLSFLSGCF